MAIWQFDLYLVPRTEISQRYGTVPQSEGPARLVSEGWWESYQPPPDYIQMISSFMGPSESPDAGLRVWGQSDGNRINILDDGARVQSIWVRVDLRASDPVFLAGVARLAAYCDCLLSTSTGRLLESTAEAIARAAARSSASGFVVDPSGFLDEISRSREGGAA